MKNFINNKFFKKQFYFIIGIISIFLLWLIASLIINNEIVLPKINSVIKAFINLFTIKNTYVVIFFSIIRLIIAILISFIISLVLAMISILSKKFSIFISPIISFLKTIPVASIIIILLVIIGHETSSIYITSLVILPIMYETFLNGMKNIDKTLLEEVKLFSNINFTVIRCIHLPLVLRTIISGIIQSFGLGLKVMVMAEFIAQPKNSIGRTILYEKQYLAMDNVFAWTLVLIILVLVVDAILNNKKNKNLIKLQ